MSTLDDARSSLLEPTGEFRGLRRKKRSRARYRTFHELYITADQKLGEGSFGKVAAYQNVETSQEVAVKVVPNLKRRNRAKVLKEVEVIHRCGKHINIVEMMEFYEESDTIYMVFEKLEGGTLLHNVRRQESLTEGDISDVLREITRGLECLHYNGIAHRDLKPSNIVCVRPGRLTPLKLIDFDLASEYIYDSSSPRKCVSTPRLRSPVGSFEYMAPDVVNVWRATQLDWSHTYDKRCDLWSLGVIAYLLLCGYLPFQGKDCGRNCGWRHGCKCDECQDLLFDEILMGHYEFPDQEWCSISDDAKHLVSKLLVTNPLHRFTTAEVLEHVWVCEHHRAASNALHYVSRKSLKDKPNELLACVGNVNLASRLVHMHLDRENSVVGDKVEPDAVNFNSEPTNGIEFKVYVGSLGDDGEVDLPCSSSCDVVKPDSSSSGVEEGSNVSSVPDGAVFDEVAACDNCKATYGCRCFGNGGHWGTADAHKRFIDEQAPEAEDEKLVSSDLEDDWSGFESCNINRSLSLFTDVSSVSCVGGDEDIFHLELPDLPSV